MPAYRKAKNVRMTFQGVIPNPMVVTTRGAQGAVRVLSVPVFPDYEWADPDKMADPKTTPDDAFIGLTWLEEAAGRNGLSIVQVDVWLRTGARGSTNSDPYGVALDDIADTFESLFQGARGDGTLLAWIPMRDFSNPALPVDTENCLFVQDPSVDGAWGMPTERRRMVNDDGFQRIVMRFAMRLTTDALRGNVYMET